MRHRVMGTAGHIDHGKTELVRALTGVDTDRLPDEKRRGITIDLGFTRLDAHPDMTLSVVDVPGHEGFIRNMVAGATGLDLVLLVIAADEGIMPQTREHLAVIELLGVATGVVAVTKTDRVQPEWLELVLDDVRETLAKTTLADAPILPVSAITGDGLDAVREAIAVAAADARARDTDDLFRQPIDRVFTVRGTGTVVTGTVWSGRLTADETVRVLPGRAGAAAGIEARVRGLQVHGRAADTVHAGERAAVALVGVDRDAIARGDVLVRESVWRAASMVTARVRMLAGAPRPLRHRQRIRLHLGTAEVMARAVPLLAGREIEPGETGLVQLRLENPTLARAGDPFVIRSYSPVATIGGGRVVEPDARKRKSITEVSGSHLNAILDGPTEAAVMARASLDGLRGTRRVRLPLDTPHSPAAVAAALSNMADSGTGVETVDEWVFGDDAIAEACRILRDGIRAYHAANPLEPGADREPILALLPDFAPEPLGPYALETLVARDLVRQDGGGYANIDFQVKLSADQEAARADILAHILDAGLAAPSVDELPDTFRDRKDPEALLRLLVRSGDLIPLPDDRYMAASILRDAVERVRTTFRPDEPVKPSDFKQVLPVTRKYLMPILAHFDRVGITIRAKQGRYIREDSAVSSGSAGSRPEFA